MARTTSTRHRRSVRNPSATTHSSRPATSNRYSRFPSKTSHSTQHNNRSTGTFADTHKLFINLPSSFSASSYRASSHAHLPSSSSTITPRSLTAAIRNKGLVPPSYSTPTSRGCILHFPSSASRWAACDSNHLWLPESCSISERRGAIVLAEVPRIEVPDSDWAVFGESQEAHRELHPKWFRFIEQLNPVWRNSKQQDQSERERVEWRVRKVELLGREIWDEYKKEWVKEDQLSEQGKAVQMKRERNLLAVWCHDQEVVEWFLELGEFQFGEGLEYRIRGQNVRKKVVKVCTICGKRGHAVRNCREFDDLIKLEGKI